jgi:hypothetical protein
MIAPIVRFAREVLDFPLFPKQAEILTAIYAESVRMAVLRLGRRSGKGRMAAVLAVWEATVNAGAHLAAVRPGERVHIVVVAPGLDQARLIRDYIGEFLRRPGLASLIERETTDELELKNGIVISTLAGNAASVRGRAVAVVVMDEAAWFSGVDGSDLDAREVANALVPATAQFPERRMLVLSTPRLGWGWFADLCADAESGSDPELRAWHVTTGEMNPLITASFLEQQRLKDPEAFAREYEAEFPTGVGAALEPSLVRAAVRAEPDTIPPKPGRNYVIAIDPAFVHDAFTLVLTHREGDRVIVDIVRGWHGTRAAPVPLETTLDTIAELAKAYTGARVITDQSTEAAIHQGLDRRGVVVVARAWTADRAVNALAAVRRHLVAGRLELPPHGVLVNELIGLEYRPSGRPQIGAAGRGHDDYAYALLAAVAELDGSDLTDEDIRHANGVWLCPRCRFLYPWWAGRPCPKCGMPAPATYDRPAPPLDEPLG